MASNETNPSRRTFIKTVAAGTAGAMLSGSMTARSYARILGANDRVRVGIVGFSDRARGSLCRHSRTEPVLRRRPRFAVRVSPYAVPAVK